MDKSKLTIILKIGYNSISFPGKIVIPIENSKLGLISYQQHKEDPLSIEKVKVEYAGENRIKLKMRGTGRLDIKNMPDLKIGGTVVNAEAGIAIESSKLCIQEPKIVNLSLPSIPGLAEEIIRKILNQNLLNTLTNELKIDLQKTLIDMKNQINKPTPFKIKLNKTEVKYNFTPGLEQINPELTISPKGIQINLIMNLRPEIKET